MSDKALSETAMLASLQDIRLPAEAAGGLWADVALSVGLAGVAALALAGLVRLFSLRRTNPRPMTLQERLGAIDQLPESDRRVALLHLLKQVSPDSYDEIRATLYRPAGGADLKKLRNEVAAHV